MNAVAPTRTPNVVFLPHADADAWALAAADDVAHALRDALAARGRAHLLVSGGSTPAPVYHLLSLVPLAWQQISIGLVDERWLPPNDPDSNARLAYATLLQAQAAAAAFTPLVRVGDDLPAALTAANATGVPASDVAVLGMGEDGHIASLFPGAHDLDAAMVSTDAYATIDAAGCPGAGRWPQRLSATPATLARAGTRILLLRGAAKRAVFERALAGDDARELPVRLLFAPAATPLRVHWTP
jgi:6-phosphogluconolactonase